MTSPVANLFKVPELKDKLLFTLLCLVIYRIGAHIATPGVNVDALADFMSTPQAQQHFVSLGMQPLTGTPETLTLDATTVASLLRA